MSQHKRAELLVSISIYPPGKPVLETRIALNAELSAHLVGFQVGQKVQETLEKRRKKGRG